MEGINEVGIQAMTKAQTGAHPNPVTIMGAFKRDDVHAAIKELDVTTARFEFGPLCQR